MISTAQPNSWSDKGKTGTAVQREHLVRTLRKQHGNAVELKESFTQTDEAVRFGLLWRAGPQAPWQSLLPDVERPRLKTARAVAFDAAAEQ